MCFSVVLAVVVVEVVVAVVVVVVVIVGLGYWWWFSGADNLCKCCSYCKSAIVMCLMYG